MNGKLELPDTPPSPGAARPTVVVAGAGFGGLWAARALADTDVDVLVLDRNNYHTFFPLLYQVAAAELAPTDIAFPIRSIFRDAENVRVRMADITSVDLDARTLETNRGAVTWDALVLALGSEPHFFGTPGAEEHAFALRWMDDAVPLREHVLRRLEAAAPLTDNVLRRRHLTFVVVGGGPTGVEFSGALSELILGPLLRDYPDISPAEVSVVLVEMGDRLLSGMAPELSAFTADRLRRRNVDVRTGTAVREVRADGVVLGDGSLVASETVVWTAGIKGNPRVAEWGFPVGRGGRVTVTPELHLPGRPDVYVVGDLSGLEGPDGRPYPQVAQVAMQQGERAAANILAGLDGQALRSFEYRDYGMMAVVGRNAAVAHVFGRDWKGFPAWIMWLAIHVAKLIGVRNRALVLVNWAWNYISFRRAVRLLMVGTRDRDEGRNTS